MSPAFRLFALLLCVVPFAPAQDEPGNSVPARPQAPKPVVVSTSFPGGTMADFVATLRRGEPKANIILATGAAGAVLPAIELRGAGLEQALEGACAVADAEFNVRVVEFRGPGESVFSVTVQERSNPGAIQQAPGRNVVETQVFSLNRIRDEFVVGGLKVQTILTAIEAGTGEDEKPPQLRFHGDSGLLIVRGTNMQVRFAKEVLSNLQRDVETRAAERKAEQSTPAGTEAKRSR